MYRTSLLIALAIAFHLPAQSQPSLGTIHGHIENNVNMPLANANIILEGTDLGTSTSSTGTFELTNIPAGTYTAIISYIGYETKQKQVEVTEGGATNLSVTLVPQRSMPQIEVIGQRPGRFDRIPGSASIISRQVIAETAPLSGHEIFRKISGVHAVEEEGAGLRANIGIRGLDPSKSRTVLMLEDGIPVALAPYGEPEMYYTPAMDRMDGVEVIKGSGSILFGPQTFGGVINYRTADPPAEPTADIHFRGGEGGFIVGRLGYGTTFNNTGVQLTYLRKQGEEVGLLDFGLNDFNAKLKFTPGNRSVIGVKLGVYDESSNSTYVGLSQAMYDAGNLDHIHLAPDDLLRIKRYSASATHDYFINEDISLKTTVFGYTTTRNWSRQDFDNSPQEGISYVRVVGDPEVQYGAIYFRDQTGNRNRQFEVAGVEPRLSVNYDASGLTNELDAGMRFLYERAFEQRVNGTVANPTSGILREDEIRTGYAFSAYFQNRLYVTDDLTFTPGLRMENFVYDRNILLPAVDVDGSNPKDRLTELIPGVGVNYQYANGSSLYAGIHRGFGPPRVKDAISSEGLSQELDAEKSWNYELGTRAKLLEGNVVLELTGFHMDFSNQIIPVSESAGGAGAGLVNGGATHHTGVEAEWLLNIGQLINSNYGMQFKTAATYVNAIFSQDRFVSSDDEMVNVRGNKLPYAPEVLISSSLNLLAPFGGNLSLTGTYTGSQYGDALNRIEGSADGRDGKMGSYFLIDASMGYNIPAIDGASVSLSVKNLLDERYISSRRPQGIRVGLPRFVSAGLDWSF